MSRRFIIEGEQKGPFGIEEVQYLKINRATLVWREGLDSWKEVNEIEELSFLLHKAPPPIPEKALEKTKTFNVNIGVKKPKINKIDVKKLKTKFAKELIINFKLLPIATVIGLIACIFTGVYLYAEAKLEFVDTQKSYIQVKKEYEAANKVFEDFDFIQYAIGKGLDTASIEKTLNLQKEHYEEKEKELSKKRSDDFLNSITNREIATAPSLFMHREGYNPYAVPYDSLYGEYLYYDSIKDSLWRNAYELYQDIDKDGSNNYVYDRYHEASLKVNNFYANNINKTLSFTLLAILIAAPILMIGRYTIKGIKWVIYTSKNKAAS